MLRLEGFDTGHLQAARAILQDALSQGETSLEVVVDSIMVEVVRRVAAIDAMAKEKAREAEVRSGDSSAPVTCEQCGSRRVKENVIEKDIILTCLDCRWSRYVGEIVGGVN